MNQTLLARVFRYLLNSVPNESTLHVPLSNDRENFKYNRPKYIFFDVILVLNAFKILNNK